MRMYDIIARKKHGEELSKEEIDFFINGYINDEIPEYQVSALLMAISFKGLPSTAMISADLPSLIRPILSCISMMRALIDVAI